MADKGKNRIHGVGFLYNTRSKLIAGLFYEEILPGCADDANIDDVVCRTNHDNNQLLGRTPNTLELELRNDGLHYWCDVAETTRGNDLIIQVDRGDIRASSFAYWVTKDGLKWGETSDGVPLRQVVRMSRIMDVAPVVNPAFEETTVGLREYAEQLELAGQFVAPLFQRAIIEKGVTESNTIDFLKNLSNTTKMNFRDLAAIAAGGTAEIKREQIEAIAKKLDVGVDRFLCAFRQDFGECQRDLEGMQMVKTLSTIMDIYR